MDDYTKYIILSHLHWIEEGITKEEIYKIYHLINSEDIFSGVNMHQIQEKMGYEVNYKEVITAYEYDKIKFLPNIKMSYNYLFNDKYIYSSNDILTFNNVNDGYSIVNNLTFNVNLFPAPILSNLNISCIYCKVS